MMHMDLLIENELKEEIYNLILEELTVNEKVFSTSKIVDEEIIEQAKKTKSIIFADGAGKRTFAFSKEVFSEKLKVHFNVTNYNFKDRKYFNTYNEKNYLDLECKSVYNVIGKKAICICYINYVSINFKPLPKFYEDVYHELNHIFQQHNAKHTYSDSIKYSNVSTNIHSQDEIKRNSAEIIYLANPYEQDSYVSSVYRFVKSKLQANDGDISKLDEFLKKSDAYGKIYRLKELFKIISDNKDLYKNEILERYGFKRWDRFDKHIRNAIHRFEKKFAMVTKKCKNDFFIYESHTWCEGPDFKSYYKIF